MWSTVKTFGFVIGFALGVIVVTNIGAGDAVKAIILAAFAAVGIGVANWRRAS